MKDGACVKLETTAEIVDCVRHGWENSKVVCTACTNSKAPKSDGSGCEAPVTPLENCQIHSKFIEQITCLSCKDGFALVGGTIGFAGLAKKCSKTEHLGCGYILTEQSPTCMGCNVESGFYATGFDAAKGTTCEKSSFMNKALATAITLIVVQGLF